MYFAGGLWRPIGSSQALVRLLPSLQQNTKASRWHVGRSGASMVPSVIETSPHRLSNIAAECKHVGDVMIWSLEGLQYLCSSPSGTCRNFGLEFKDYPLVYCFHCVFNLVT